MSPQEVRALDPRTLLFSLGVLGLVMAAVFLHFARAMPAYRAGLVAWSRAMAAAGIAFLLYFLRGQAPLLLTFVVANAVMLGLGHWGHVAHARLLDEAPRRRWNLAASAIGLGGVLACYGLGLPRQVAFIAMSVAFAMMLGATALLVLRGTGEQYRSPSALASLLSHAALAVAFTVRVIVGLLVDERLLMPGAVSVTQLFTLVPGMVLVVVCSLCFLGMVHERHMARAEARHQDLERAARQVEQASAMKSRFLASMSHEIRTPLNAILGTVQLLERRATDKEQRRLAGSIRTAGRTLLALVDDALDLARIESGRLRLEHRPFRLQDVLARVIEVFGPMAEARGLRLTLLPLPEGLPPLTGDAQRLEQVVSNLVGNAIKFTDHGAVTVEAARLGQGPQRVTLRLAVRDSGIGIAADDIDRIFEAFIQADTFSGSRRGGTGLGLAICRQLVTLMGGEIGATSQPGVGSEFWLRLDFDVAEASAEVAAAVAPVPHEPRLEGLRVLVADDVPANLEVARRLLELEGAVCLVAGDGQEALQRLRDAGGGIDIVLMDVQMPRLDGIEATRRLRADAALSGVPVIALSAGALPSQREQALSAGMDDFLCKPIELDALVDVVLRWTAPLPQPAPGEGGDAPVGAAPTCDEAFPVVDGIDHPQARRRFLGDAALFQRLLQGLLEEGAGLVDAVRADMAQGRWAEAALRVHRLRGQAANLSADALVRAAAALEAALRAQPPVVSATLLQAVDDALRTLAAALPARSMPVPGALHAATPSAPAPAPARVAALLAALDAGDTGALDHFEALREALIAAQGPELIGRLEQALHGLRFQEAGAMLQRWGYRP